MTIESDCGFGADPGALSVQALSAHYHAFDESLRQYASEKPETVKSEQENFAAIESLLNCQRQALELVAGSATDSFGDMVAKLEIWKIETVESEDVDNREVGATDRLVLSVLEALRRRI